MHTLHPLTARRVSTPGPVVRAADVVAGTLLLVVSAPLMAVLALAVRLSSHGPVLHREPVITAAGRRLELLSFRTTVDGGNTTAHERVRAVVGADERAPLTPAGRFLRAARLERLPRLLNVVSGSASIFG
jgi:lipopolysaccharide/colanic/teichoic acid biosynthesis glycosyltransferase